LLPPNVKYLEALRAKKAIGKFEGDSFSLRLGLRLGLGLGLP
jgi:hypothetical protein